MGPDILDRRSLLVYVCCNFIRLLVLIEAVFLAGYPAIRPAGYPAHETGYKKAEYLVQPYLKDLRPSNAVFLLKQGPD